MPRVCSRLFLCLAAGARACHNASADTKQALTQSKHPTPRRCGYWSLVRAATTTRRPSSRATRCSFHCARRCVQAPSRMCPCLLGLHADSCNLLTFRAEIRGTVQQMLRRDRRSSAARCRQVCVCVCVRERECVCVCVRE